MFGFIFISSFSYISYNNLKVIENSEIYICALHKLGLKSSQVI